MEKFLIGSVTAFAGVTAFVTTLYVWRRRKRNRSHRVEIKIHSTEVGYVIGKCGERVKDIIQKSGAKIKFFLEGEPFDYCVCIIEGDETKVQKARSIVYQILQQCADMDMSSCFVLKGTNIDDSLLSGKLFNEDSQTNDSLLQQSLVTDYVAGHTQKLDASNTDGLIPVYMSAVASPNDFWVQSIKTKEHIQLDRMTEELREFYETSYNILPSYSEVKRGLICATREEDGRWYRAEVCEVFTLNENDANETNVDLYLLDYGISSYQKIKNIRIIPKKFLDLKFQAIQCKLSNVQPNGENWSQESITFFEEITHSGEWCTLMARLDDVDENGRSHVTLIDSNSGVRSKSFEFFNVRNTNKAIPKQVLEHVLNDGVGLQTLPELAGTTNSLARLCRCWGKFEIEYTLKRITRRTQSSNYALHPDHYTLVPFAEDTHGKIILLYRLVKM